MYWVDPGKVPLSGVVIVFSVYLFSTTLGFILLFKFASWRKGSQFWLFLLAIFGLLFLGALFPERLFLLGTLKDFQNQTLVPVFEVKPIFFTILIGGAILLLLGLYMVRSVSRTRVDPN